MSNTHKTLNQFTFSFNPQDNVGEFLSLKTEFINNGEPGIVYYQQELTLNSYCNQAKFVLSNNMLTPAKLRELANFLEREENRARFKLEQGKETNTMPAHNLTL